MNQSFNQNPNPVTTERYQHNIAVLRQLKAGKADAALLKSYTGWGGLRKALSMPAIYQELKTILGEEEIISVKKTLTSAYYTPEFLVKFMYAWLQNQGFKGGAILEPSVGHGVFLEHLPAAIQANSQITAVEIDKVTSQIVKALYPDIDLHCCPFEQYQPQQKFDLVIGNPPYGANKVFDAQHADLKDYCVHHYFVAKSMRLLKAGGVLTMLLPSWFLDNVTQNTRQIIHQEGGNLIAAYRLPNDLFNDARVTVDIVFMRKGQTGQEWVTTRPVSIAGESKKWALNSYYHNNPKHILGKLAVVDMYSRRGLTCRRTAQDVSARLFRQLPASTFQAETSQETRIEKALKIADRKINQLQNLKQQLTQKQQDLFAVQADIQQLMQQVESAQI